MASNTSENPLKRKRGVWLIGKTIDHFPGNKLPSRGERGITPDLSSDGSNPQLKECIKQTAQMVSEVWDTAKIPTVTPYNDLLKSSRTTGKALENRKRFVETLDDLLDVAHVEAEKLIKNKEDRDFLEAQRRPCRPGCMLEVDKHWSKKVAAREKRLEQEVCRRQKTSISTIVQFDELSSSSTSQPSSEMDSCDDFSPSPKIKVSHRKRPQRIISRKVAAALDRNQISNRQATHLLVPFAADLGHNVDSLALSTSSIRRQRNELRNAMAAEFKESFSSSVRLTLHWDGKLMTDLNSQGKIERLPILVSGDEIQKMLAVPKLSDGKAEPTAKVIVEVLAEWKKFLLRRGEDEEVSAEKKRGMIHCINTTKGSEEPNPRLHLTSEDVSSENLPEFFTSNTTKLLQRLNIDPSFVNTDPITWDTMDAYVRGKDRVSKLLVTNDVAERGVATVQ